MKKLIALLLVLVMALSLVACGGAEETAETPRPLPQKAKLLLPPEQALSIT